MTPRPLLVLFAFSALTGAAAAQERQWTLDAGDQDAYLIFGVADSDDVGISLWCPIRQGTVTIFVPEPGGSLPADREVTVTLTAGDKTTGIKGKTEVNEDAGLSSVAKCKNLQRLNVSRTAITDAGLAALKGNTQLNSLNLVSTAITDAGLSYLVTFKKLEKLYLMQSKVTESGMEKLAKALPELTINHGPHFSTVTVEEPTGGKKKKKK